jgi:hypothetical protein
VAGSQADAAADEEHFAGAVPPGLKTTGGHPGAYPIRRPGTGGDDLLVDATG